MAEVLSLRKTSNKYYFLHPNYRDQDKADILPAVKNFAKEFDIPYDSIKISRKASKAIYRVHSSEKGEGDGYSIDIYLWLILKWYEKYSQGVIEYYERP